MAQRAFPYAQLIARSLSASIELIQAFDIPPLGMFGEGSQFVVDQMLAEARNRAEDYLSEIRVRLEAEGHSVSTTAMRSSPAEAIMAQASIDPSALVVMSTHGRGGIARWVLGSVADKVLHTLPNPMLVVRSAAPTQPAAPTDSVRRVLVPLDGSQLAESGHSPRYEHRRRAVRRDYAAAGHADSGALPTGIGLRSHTRWLA